jgi:hypothetical protein
MAQLAGDRLRQPGGGLGARRHGADQRHGDVAGGVHRVGVGEAVLAEHDDAQPVAGVERVGRLEGGVDSIRHPACARGERQREGGEDNRSDEHGRPLASVNRWLILSGDMVNEAFTGRPSGAGLTRWQP